MGNINSTYFDRVRYTLKNKNMGSVIITEPVGWKDDEKELVRHSQYHGMVASFSNSSKYIGDGADYIQMIYDIYGINAQIELIREEKHPQTDAWTLSYSGYLDLSTWSREKNQVSVKFNSGGIETLLKSRESEKVEIDRITSIDGNPIPELETVNVELDGRRIFLKTSFTIKPTENYISLSNISSDGNVRGSKSCVPLALVNQSHENAHSPIPGTIVGDKSWARSANGESALMFFAVSDKDRILRVKINLKFKVNISVFDDVDFFRFWLLLTTYANSSNYDFKENRTLFTDDNAGRLNGNTFSVNFDQEITLLAGESLALTFDQNVDFINTASQRLEMNATNIEGDLSIDENSFQEKTTSKAVLAHEVGERLIAIATNQSGAFYSDYLGRTDIGYSQDGQASLTGFSHGFWVRGFDKLPLGTDDNPNLFKPLTTSFKDFFSSLNTVWPVGIAVEKTGSIERVRLEELSYFYNRNPTIKLGQVKNVKREVAVDKYYSSLEFGSTEGGDYDEACGLDEYNAKSTFTTIINRLKNVYTQISEYRKDSYGLEFARRKPKSLNDTEDTSYDNAIWMLDLKRYISTLFKQRLWQDDFEKEPTGVFSPETATGLRFSPFNCMLRHSWWFSGGFKKYASDYIRYGSSTANSQLKTKLNGGNEYAENGNVVNSELMSPRFLPEEIEFEYECGFGTMQQVNGTTVILGKTIQNFYGLVQFKNEKNEIEYGYLISLKPNGKGLWKLIKANR